MTGVENLFLPREVLLVAVPIAPEGEGLDADGFGVG